ncbi:MAG: M14 family metallopeptidase [Gaiellales bacterium]
MERLTYDRFYDYDALRDLLDGWAGARPELMRVESIGRSWEGREIPLVTLTAFATGEPLTKPGFLVDGNMHSIEWTGGHATLHLIDRLLRGHGADERVTRLLDTRCLYVVPRLNPDGTEHALREGRFTRSTVRPYPSAEPATGLHVRDIDGDGRILFMRIPDPNGAFTPHPAEPRLLVARDPDDDRPGPHYRLAVEGEVVGYDGVTFAEAPAIEGIDLGANFPGSNDLARGPADGPYPGSEPEIRAYLHAIAERPNICGYVTCHTFGGIVLHPPAAADEEVPAFDRRVFRRFAEKAEALTGYRAMSYLDLVYEPGPARSGAFDWLYHRLGVLTWITEFWNPLLAAGIEHGTFHPSGWLWGVHPVEDELALLRWHDASAQGRAFVDWYPFEHPQLGPVELGGWDKINAWYNPPFDLLEQEIAPHSDWVIFQLLSTPCLVLGSVEAELVDEGVYRVRAVVQNAGWLPTNVTEKALTNGVCGEVLATIELPPGARLVAGSKEVTLGQLAGREGQRSSSTWWSHVPATDDRALAEWVVATPAGSEVTVTFTHPRAGCAAGSVALG